MRNILPFAIAILLLWAAIANATAAMLTAKIESTSGDVRVAGDEGEGENARKGQRLKPGDTLITGADGVVKVSMSDGSSLDLQNESSLEITRQLLENDGNGFSFSLLLGYLAAAIRTPKTNDLIVTPSGTLGIRGTKFSVSVAVNGVTVFSVSEGTVDVRSVDGAVALHDADKSMQLTSGNEVVIEQPGQTLQPRPRRIESYAVAKRFLQEQVHKMTPQLPGFAAALGHRLESELSQLDKLLDLWKKQVDDIQALQSQVRQMRWKQRGTAERGEAIYQLHKAINKLKDLARQALVKATRIRAMFVKTSILLNRLPGLKQQLGPAYPTVQKALESFLGERFKTRIRIRSVLRQARRAARPISGIIRSSLRRNKETKLIQMGRE